METLPSFSTVSNGTDGRNPNGNIFESEDLKQSLCYLIILTNVPGIVGNGMVIRFLGFWIKRNYFTIYILNLAVADSGSLIFLFLTGILTLTNKGVHTVITICFIFTYCTGQFLLTIISIDWCLALFFPIWHQCHQPPYLSPILCTITWTACLLLPTVTLIKYTGVYIFICTSVSILLMVASSLPLFIKGFLKSQMQKRGKLLTAILLAVFFSLVFSIPPVVIYFIGFFSKGNYLNVLIYVYLCACLNSSVNPLIYFLLGRQKAHNSRCNPKIIFQGLFSEEEECEEQSEVPVDNQL